MSLILNTLTQDQLANLGLAGISGALIGSMLVFTLLISIALYIYFAWAWFSIARKLKEKHAWFAWVPILQYFLYPKLAKKHWGWGFLFLIPIVNLIVFTVWKWEIFERVKFPGYLSLYVVLYFIPVINLFAILAHMVVIGIIAWSKKR